MRRYGADPRDVVKVLLGPHNVALLVLEAIRAYPVDLVAREKAWRQIARLLTAPNRRHHL